MPNETEVRPFRVAFPEEDLAELRRRIAATRWPERETVTDHSQGVPLAMMHARRVQDATLTRALS